MGSYGRDLPNEDELGGLWSNTEGSWDPENEGDESDGFFVGRVVSVRSAGWRGSVREVVEALGLGSEREYTGARAEEEGHAIILREVWVLTDKGYITFSWIE